MFFFEKLGCPSSHAGGIRALHEVSWGKIVNCCLNGAPGLVGSGRLKRFIRASMDGFVIRPDGMDRLVDGASGLLVLVPV